MMPKQAVIFGMIVSMIVGLCVSANAGGKQPACKKIPRPIIESGKNFAACLLYRVNPPNGGGAIPPEMENLCVEFNIMVFNNHEKVLPKANNNTYYEGRANGVTDQNRFVFLVETKKNKGVISNRYFSTDHYASFCQLN